jgi:hypothetical protein
VSPTEVIGRTDPLPTMMDEGVEGLGGRKREMLQRSGVVWFDAPELATHSVSESGCWSIIVLKEFASNCCSHQPCHDVQGGDILFCHRAAYNCGGARIGTKGGVKGASPWPPFTSHCS